MNAVILRNLRYKSKINLNIKIIKQYFNLINLKENVNMEYYTKESFIKEFGEDAWQSFVEDRACPQCDAYNEMEEGNDESIDGEMYTRFSCDSDVGCADFAVRIRDIDD